MLIVCCSEGVAGWERKMTVPSNWSYSLLAYPEANPKKIIEVIYVRGEEPKLRSPSVCLSFLYNFKHNYAPVHSKWWTMCSLCISSLEEVDSIERERCVADSIS
jgi:hypothetical protein